MWNQATVKMVLRVRNTTTGPALALLHICPYLQVTSYLPTGLCVLAHDIIDIICPNFNDFMYQRPGVFKSQLI